MQIRIFTISVFADPREQQELNTFLRSKRVLNVEKHFYVSGDMGVWTFCIEYVDDITIIEKERPKVDYKLVLDDSAFKRFSTMRVKRKELSLEEAVPAFVIFTDEELSQLAKIEDLDLEKMKAVPGIGEKKIEKYAKHFIK
jgi:superfamily II DNA helicase RecQ